MLNESRRDQNAHSFCQDPTHCILYFGCVRACFIWSTYVTACWYRANRRSSTKSFVL